MVRTFLFALFSMTAAVGAANAQSYGMAPKPGETVGDIDTSKINIEQNLGKTIPPGIEFTDHNKKPVMLQELMGGKPAILVLAYYRCPKLCNEVLRGVLDAMKSESMMRDGFIAGKQYSLIVVSIDPKESPEMARQRREQFLAEYDGRSFDQDGVWFLTANRGQGETNLPEAEARIKQLADSVGFHFQYDKKFKQYMHASGIMILSPDGVITRYFLGIPSTGTYFGRDIRLAIIEASDGKVGTVYDRMASYCFMYDQKSGKYQPVMRSLALVSLPFVALVFGVAWYTVRRVRRDVNPAVTAALPPNELS